MAILERILYRGDATRIAQFDQAKTSDRNLFGPGIYLTDDPEIAGDYTLKGSAEVLYSDPEATSQRDLIAGYIRLLIDHEIKWPEKRKQLEQEWAVENLRDHRRGDVLPGMKDREWRSLLQFLNDRHKQLATSAFPHVQARLRKSFAALKVVRNTVGALALIKGQRSAAIAAFDIPDDILNTRMLHAERPLPDRVLRVIRKLWINELGPRGHGMRDRDENEVVFDRYLKNYKWHGTRYAFQDHYIGGTGENPTFDELRNGTHGGYHVFSDSLFDKNGRHSRFVQAMTKLGYLGLEYNGGMRVGGFNRGGGGRAHRAYVFWDGDMLAKYRLPDREPPAGFDPERKAAQRHQLARLYRPPT